MEVAGFGSGGAPRSGATKRRREEEQTMGQRRTDAAPGAPLPDAGGQRAHDAADGRRLVRFSPIKDYTAVLAARIGYMDKGRVEDHLIKKHNST